MRVTSHHDGLLHFIGRERLTRLVWLAVAFALAASATAHAVRTLRDRRTPMEWVLHSDFLTPAAVYQDLTTDGYSLLSFRPSAATFVVPDYAAYFAVRPLIPDTTVAVLVWEAVLFVLLVAAAVGAFSALAPPPVRPYLTPAAVCLGTIYLSVNARHFFCGPEHDLFLPVSHVGAQTCGFVSLYVITKLVGSGTTRAVCFRTAGLASLTAAAVFSNRLFVLYFVAPVFFSLVVERLTRQSLKSDGLTWTRGRLTAGISAVVAGCGLALVALKLLQGGPDDPMNKYWTGVQWAGSLDRAEWLWRAVLEQAELGNLLVLSAAGWYSTYLGSMFGVSARVLTPQTDRGFALYQTYTVAQLAAVAGGFLLSGAGAELHQQAAPWGDYSRYFCGPAAASFFGWAFLFARWASPGNPTWQRAAGFAAPTAVAAMYVTLGAVRPTSLDRELADLRPENVRDIDEACVAAGVTDGLADYWTAKPVTLLSRHGVRLRQVAADREARFGVRPFHWLSNAEWYWRPSAGTDAVRYQFVLASETPDGPLSLPAAGVVATLGPPARVVPAGRYAVLVYDRPTDEQFRRFSESDPAFLRLRYNVSRPAAVRYPGAALAGGRLQATGSELVASAGQTPAGAITVGPFLNLKSAGRHRVVFRVTASGAEESNAVVDVVNYNAAAGETNLLARSSVPAGFDGEIPLPFHLTKQALSYPIQTRVIYTGRGRVELRWVDIDPAP